jgi:hypothetical protein
MRVILANLREAVSKSNIPSIVSQNGAVVRQSQPRPGLVVCERSSLAWGEVRTEGERREAERQFPQHLHQTINSHLDRPFPKKNIKTGSARQALSAARDESAPLSGPVES